MTTPTSLATTTATPNWNKGACTRRIDDLFFPIGDSAASRAQADQAKLVCARCPIRRACLSWALENREDEGVWGGLTEKERRAVHRRRVPWGSTRNAVERIYGTQLGEFTALLDRGLAPMAIAQAMRTNVQTVNKVMERIAAAQTGQEVQPA